MEETLTQNTTPEIAAPVAPVEAARPPFQRGERNNSRGPRGGGRGGNSRGPRRDTRQKPEFDQKIVSLRRVVRVTSGGRRFAFSACVVAGNKKGMVGVGLGKATDTPLAIEKAA